MVCTQNTTFAPSTPVCDAQPFAAIIWHPTPSIAASHSHALCAAIVSVQQAHIKFTLFTTFTFLQVLPFFQFYRGAEGRVAEFSASVAKVQRLRDALAEHSPARCSLGNESPGLESLNTLLASRETSAQVHT